MIKRRYNYHFLWSVYWSQGTPWQAVSGWSGRTGRPCSSHSDGQTNQHFDLKLWFSKHIFILFFAGVDKSSAFCALWLLWHKVEISEQQFDTNKLIHNLDISTFGYSSHSVQKALDFSTPAKNRIKMNLENQSFRSKCWLVWLPKWLELGLPLVPL